MAAVTSNPNQARARRVAVKRVEGFAKQFGEAHRNLARHAAFPLSLTPDLLYQIWANFVPEAPWEAVAHLLLSRLCRQVGYEMYEMDIADRNLLLRELKEQFGQERLDELAEFLLDYVAQRLTDDDPDTQSLAEAQEWTALAYTKPNELARELAEALSTRVKQEDMTEVFRLASLVEMFAQPLQEAGFKPLLVYANRARNLIHGDPKKTKNKLSQIQEHKLQEEANTISSQQREKTKIMVIDDDRDNLDLLYRTFRREFQVFKAESGITALKILEQEGEMAVVVTDQRMPLMNGTEVLCRIREFFPDTVRIILTGFMDIEDIIDATNFAHIFKYITKPWNPEEIRNIIQQAVNIYQSRKQLKNHLSVIQSDQLHEVGNTIDTSLQPSFKPRLMVVDDDLENLNLLERLFCRDFQTFQLNDALSALDILDKEEEMAVIITDQRMPIMRGTEFLGRIREIFPDTVRIILSGYTEPEDLVEAINLAHVFKYITKPYESKHLKKVVQEAVHIYRTNKQITKSLAK
ncbi:MAG: response regulator [Coleofasciculus sp. A1-SPW-01]|uniref:response regulator n=1 Tax=Coleofasciculus sp. A1-SPW-01 TaxID=3070819 RepID=UPI0032F9F055